MISASFRPIKRFNARCSVDCIRRVRTCCNEKAKQSHMPCGRIWRNSRQFLNNPSQVRLLIEAEGPRYTCGRRKEPRTPVGKVRHRLVQERSVFRHRRPPHRRQKVRMIRGRKIRMKQLVRHLLRLIHRRRGRKTRQQRYKRIHMKLTFTSRSKNWTGARWESNPPCGAFVKIEK